jgi:hypothetical protein
MDFFKLGPAYTALFFVFAKTNRFCLALRFICYSCSSGDVKKVFVFRKKLTAYFPPRSNGFCGFDQYKVQPSSLSQLKKETVALRVTVNI